MNDKHVEQTHAVCIDFRQKLCSGIAVPPRQYVFLLY